MEVNACNFECLPVHEKALICAKLCRYSYQFNRNEKSNLIGIKKTNIEKISNLRYRNIQYHIYENNEHQFLIISGTDTKSGIKETISDLLVSLNLFPKKNESGLYAHRGYSIVGDKIIEQLCRKRVLNKNKKLVIAGHSLGGAISKYISTHIDSNAEIFTFGSPQVTYESYYVFKGDIIESHYSNKCDWITSYPSTLYDDHRYMYIIDGGKLEIHRAKKIGILIPFIYMSITLLLSRRMILNDHSIDTYIMNLEKFLKN